MDTKEFERRLELARQQGAPEEVIRQARINREERLKNPWNGDERCVPADVVFWQDELVCKLNKIEDMKRCRDDQNMIDRKIKELNTWINTSLPTLSINDTY